MSNDNRPKLIPARVPWSVAASAAHLRVEADGYASLAATFVGYFELDDRSDLQFGKQLQIADDPAQFEARAIEERSGYRMVRILFEGGHHWRVTPAVADGEVIPEDAYDWSNVVGGEGLMPGESIQSYLNRLDQYILNTGLAACPGFYEVQGSPWLLSLGAQGKGLHHYLIQGDDEYAEIIARDWSWEPGQAVN